MELERERAMGKARDSDKTSSRRRQRGRDGRQSGRIETDGALKVVRKAKKCYFFGTAPSLIYSADVKEGDEAEVGRQQSGCQGMAGSST